MKKINAFFKELKEVLKNVLIFVGIATIIYLMF